LSSLPDQKTWSLALHCGRLGTTIAHLLPSTIEVLLQDEEVLVLGKLEALQGIFRAARRTVDVHLGTTSDATETEAVSGVRSSHPGAVKFDKYAY